MLILDFPLLLILALAAFGIGSIVSNRLHEKEGVNPIFSWGVETGLGLGLIALFTFFLGIFKLLYWWLSWSIMIVAAVYGVLCLRKLIFSRLRLKLSINLIYIIYIIPVLLVVATIGLIIIDYFAPANCYDDLKYHLAIPRLCVETHKLYPFSTTFHSYWPSNLEMLITNIMMLGTDTGGRGVSLLLLLAFAGILWGLTRQIHKDFSGVVPVILLFTLPTVLSQARVASSDLAGSIWMLGAIALLIAWLEDYEPKFCLLSGAFMGFALGTKYNFMYEIAVSVLVVFIYGLIFRRPFLTIKNIKVMILSVLIAIIVASPWYIKNWILTGNPLYPFYYSIFGGINWSEGLDKEFMIWLKSDYARPVLSKIPSSFLKEGFRIFYLLPLSLISCRKPKHILIISLTLVNFLAWYYLGTYQLRFGITWQVLLVVAIAYGLLEITRRWRYFHYFIMPVLCAFLIWQLPVQYKSEIPRMKVVFGQQTKEDYLTKSSALDDMYPLIDYANKNLPDGTIIATFWQNAGYYYSKHEYYMLNPLVSGVIDHTSIDSPEDYAKAVINTGTTHLLYASNKAKFFIAQPRTARYSKLHNWHEYFIRNHTKFLKRNKAAFLYEIIHEAGKMSDKTVIPEIFVQQKQSIQQTYSITSVNESIWTDCIVECDVIIPSYANIVCAGIIARYDPKNNNGMRFWIRVDNPSAQLSYWKSMFQHIWEQKYPIKKDTKYRLKVIAKGDKYSCFIDDKLVKEFEDNTKAFHKGRVALIAYGANLQLFDEVFSNIIIIKE